MNNKYFRVVAQSILGIAIGLTGNAFFSNVNEILKAVLICLFVIFLLAEIGLSVYYVHLDKKEQTELQEKKQEIERLKRTLSEEKKLKDTFSHLIEDLNKCYEPCATKIYKLVEKARETNEIDLNIWNHHNVSDFVCSELYQLVKSLAQYGEDFSVSYIIPEKDKKSKTHYFMISYDGNETAKPHIYNHSIPKKDAEKYYFAKLFKKNNPAVSYLMDSQDVAVSFYYADPSDKGKYSQYIGIPVYCSGHNMIGLLQIVAHRGSKITSDQAQMESIVNKYIMGYANLILFAEKVQKGITFVP